MAKKYELPDFLKTATSQLVYERWLRRKAAAQVKRDRKRGNPTANGERYRLAIHQAVVSCEGNDSYTGESLRWDLISTYTNESSRVGRRRYKATLALLPTVDHVGDGLGPAAFRICAWRTNDAKNDLSLPEFIDLCRRVVAHFESNSRADDPSPLVGESKGGGDSRTFPAGAPPTTGPSPQGGGESARGVGHP